MASEMDGVSGVEMVFPYEVCEDPQDMKQLLKKYSLGVSAVNALSEWCEVRVCRDGKEYFQRYERGIPQEAVKQIGKCDVDSTKRVFEQLCGFGNLAR